MDLTIAEAARRTGLTPHTLRYYERDGLLLGEVRRATSGHRRYTERDLGWITMLTRLRATGMPIREIKQYAALARRGEGNETDRLEILLAPRARTGPAGRGAQPPDRHRRQGRAVPAPGGGSVHEWSAQRLTWSALEVEDSGA